MKSFNTSQMRVIKTERASVNTNNDGIIPFFFYKKE